MNLISPEKQSELIHLYLIEKLKPGESISLYGLRKRLEENFLVTFNTQIIVDSVLNEKFPFWIQSRQTRNREVLVTIIERLNNISVSQPEVENEDSHWKHIHPIFEKYAREAMLIEDGIKNGLLDPETPINILGYFHKRMR